MKAFTTIFLTLAFLFAVVILFSLFNDNSAPFDPIQIELNESNTEMHSISQREGQLINSPVAPNSNSNSGYESAEEPGSVNEVITPESSDLDDNMHREKGQESRSETLRILEQLQR